MGHKINPTGFRLGINRTWDSRWFAARHRYGDLLHEDLKLRRYLKKRLHQAGVARIVIERPAKKARITIHTARPGVVIGKKGADIEVLRELNEMRHDPKAYIGLVKDEDGNIIGDGTEKEARLVYLGVHQGMPVGEGRSLVVDIGGGSVEFIVSAKEGVPLPRA